MKRKQKHLVRLGLVSAMIALGAGVGTAQARDHYRGYHGDGHRHFDGCGCEVPRTAGFITIDGCKTQISSGRGMLAQITRAFRKAGYRSWIEDGCVRVDYGHCKPSVRWHADGYSVRIKWGWDELGLSLHRASRSFYEPLRPMRRMRPVYRYGRCG